MMMVALSPDAKGHLDHYLEQIRMALSGQESIDADEIERDVLSHIMGMNKSTRSGWR